MLSSSSSSSKSDGENSFDVEELVQIGTRCRELRKEKEMLQESQSHSFDLIRKLELHVKSLTEARLEDKKQIQKLEKELLNCYQEIDYLQDQLNARSEEVNCLSEHVRELEAKLAERGRQISYLTEELNGSKSECLLLLRELDSKEIELQNSALSMEKLEESILSLTLESQCEIESMKLDVITLEQALFDAKKIEVENAQEKSWLSAQIEELQAQFQAREKIKCLDKENRELRKKYATFEMNVKKFCQKIQKWLENNDVKWLNAESFFRETRNEPFFRETRNELPVSEEVRELFDTILKKLVLLPDANLKQKMEGMSKQILEYEQLVKQLKEELKVEKLKAKEEAEDLTQEMAELRYKMTCLLEEECKRRAYIEQASLQRITELEAQIKREKRKSFAGILTLSDA